MPICFVILLPLVMVRKIQTFAKFHVFGDAMIFITLTVIVIFASVSVSNNGFLDHNPAVPWFNKKLWPDSIGFAIYAFEGIGVILPVQDITEDREGYFKIICITCCFITLVYISFSEFCLFTYFDRFNSTGPLITDYLPVDNKFCWTIKILFCF
jgi:proton-coupled amino acid transporter